MVSAREDGGRHGEQGGLGNTDPGDGDRCAGGQHARAQQRTVTQQVPIPEQSSGVFTIEETRKYAFEYDPLGEMSAERP